jgi:parallel beta helix pectate lyase-like protein/fibronectin type III domain protein
MIGECTGVFGWRGWRSCLGLVVGCAGFLVLLLVGQGASAAAGAVVLGRQIPGSQWFAMGADYKRSSRFALSEAGSATALVAYLDGWGGTGGSQQVRFALYADQAGEPGALLAQSAVGTIAAGAAASWVKLPLLNAVSLAAGSYHLAILSGQTGGVARYSREPLSNALRSVGDSFADGASNPYGLAGPDDYQVAIYAVVSATVVAAPVNLSPPVISGTAVVGAVLSASQGVWANAPTGYAYQWRRCNSSGASCIDISGQTGSTHAVVSADQGATLRVAVIAVNAAGSTTAVSAASAVVVVDSMPPSAPTGLTVAGATATSIALSWSPASDNVGVAGYDLFRNGAKLATTTGTSYTFGGLACATSYTLAVDAFDHASNVSAKASITASTSACGGAVFYVSPAGSDSNPGTLAQPWKTLKKTIGALLPGQTAYLRAGVYQEQLSGSCGTAYNKLYWTRSGTVSQPITISGYPGEQKQVLVQTAITLAGDYERLQRLVVGKNLGWSSFDHACTGGPNLNLLGLNDSLTGVEVRNSAMSGVYLEGADGARLVANWIHDNGSHYNLDHGVYWFSGARGLAADNIVQHNYANGLKIGPNAQSVLVTENTVNGNGRSGIIVSGDSTYTSNNNTIADNIVSWNAGCGIRTYWESAGVGSGNKAVRNLLYGNANGNSWYPGGGMSESGTLVQDPLYLNRLAGDYHLQSASPAIDAADPTLAVSTAYDGTNRPKGKGPDIGAYEQ